MHTHFPSMLVQSESRIALLTTIDRTFYFSVSIIALCITWRETTDRSTTCRRIILSPRETLNPDAGWKYAQLYFRMLRVHPLHTSAAEHGAYPPSPARPGHLLSRCSCWALCRCSVAIGAHCPDCLDRNKVEKQMVRTAQISATICNDFIV